MISDFPPRTCAASCVLVGNTDEGAAWKQYDLVTRTQNHLHFKDGQQQDLPCRLSNNCLNITVVQVFLCHSFDFEKMEVIIDPKIFIKM